MARIYLDYAATTPVDQRVLHAMEPYFLEKFGNPGSLHSFGQEAITAVDFSRETIARAIGVKSDEIILTGSATEANNLAMRGIVKRVINNKLRINGKEGPANPIIPRIIVSAVEHESVLETARNLERDGAEVFYLPVDKCGVVDLGALKKALNEHTVLVSVMYANNEIGTVQPIAKISEIIRNFCDVSGVRCQVSGVKAVLPLLHTDAAQAFQFLDCDVNKLGVDMMTLSAHKIYGPKGVGGLYVRTSDNKQMTTDKKIARNGHVSGVRGCVSPVITGGMQEFGLRSGTENVPAIVGFAKATELLFSNSQEHWNKKIGGLRDYFWDELKKVCPEAELNGCQVSRRRQGFGGQAGVRCQVLPSILNVYFPNHEAQFLLTKLDMAGVAASSGSACRSRSMESSHVIEALGYSRDRAKRSIRFSFGRPTTKEEIDSALKIIKQCL